MKASMSKPVTNTPPESGPLSASLLFEESNRDICFKIFVVVTIILATVIVVVGILALMAARGALPAGMGPILKLNVIGEVNSFVMLGGGIVLFILGMLAWSYHFKKEQRHPVIKV